VIHDRFSHRTDVGELADLIAAWGDAHFGK